MIIPRSDGTVDIEIPADAPWLDAFRLRNGTRPIEAGWTAFQLIIRPAFNYPTPLRILTSAGDDAEIIVDDADRGAFHFEVAQSVLATLPVGAFVHMGRLLYVDSDTDARECWRGKFTILPGLITS